MDDWSIKLHELQLWEVVIGTKAKPAANAGANVIKVWDLKDLKARNIIQLVLDLTMMTHAREATTSQSIWGILPTSGIRRRVSCLLSLPPGNFITKVKVGSSASHTQHYTTLSRRLDIKLHQYISPCHSANRGLSMHVYLP